MRLVEDRGILQRCGPPAGVVHLSKVRRNVKGGVWE